jgi:hypothetical protein
MLLHTVLRQVVAIVQSIAKDVEARVRAWTKPATDSLVGGTAADLYCFMTSSQGGASSVRSKATGMDWESGGRSHNHRVEGDQAILKGWTL